jgi:hypothetical protein
MQKTLRAGKADDVFVQLDSPASRYQAVLFHPLEALPQANISFRNSNSRDMRH